MKSHSSRTIIALILLIVLMLTALLSTSGKAAARFANPTPGGKAPTPEAGGTLSATQQAPEVSFGSGKAGAPPTLKDLYTKYPTLRAYVDKLDQMDDLAKEMDFKEFYTNIAMIYNDYGAPGVDLFLQETGLDDELGIPLAYFDLIDLYEAAGWDKVIAQAMDWGFINAHDELVGFLEIDPPEQLDAVKAELKKMGIVIYGWDVEDEVLEIGIPLKTLTDLKTPDAVLKYMATIADIDGVYEYFEPEIAPATPAAK